MIQHKCLQVGRPRNLILILSSLIFLTSCQLRNSRAFTFTYTVNLEQSYGEKVELWLPVPKSNEGQIISNLNILCEGLSYEIKHEKNHNNKYVYIYNDNGINQSKVIKMSFNVQRFEHQNINDSSINSDDYLKASLMVPVGNIFNEIIENNNLNNNDMRGLYDYVLSGMHYGKPKSIDSKYYDEPWLSAGKTYGMKKVTRDEVVQLYKHFFLTYYMRLEYQPDLLQRLFLRFLYFRFLKASDLDNSFYLIQINFHLYNKSI